MRFTLRIEVSLKPGYIDPEGETTARLLKELCYKVEKVDIRKIYKIILEAESRQSANRKAEEMCSRLLANPTKDSYTITIEEEE